MNWASTLFTSYDESISVLRASLDAAKVGDREKLEGFRRLEKFTRAVESRCEPRADFEATVRNEFSISRDLGGRSVFDDRQKKAPRPKSRQLRLF